MVRATCFCYEKAYAERLVEEITSKHRNGEDVSLILVASSSFRGFHSAQCGRYELEQRQTIIIQKRLIDCEINCCEKICVCQHKSI